MGDIVVGICYRPPHQEKQVDEALYRQVEAISDSEVLVFMVDLNHEEQIIRARPRPSVRPPRPPSPAPLPGGAEPRGAQAPPAARRSRGRWGIPARPPVLSPGPGAPLSAGRGGPAPAWRAAPGRSPAPRSPARRGSLRHRRRRCYCCRPGLSGRWVPRSAWARFSAGARRPPPSLSARLPPSPSFLPPLPPAPSPLPAFPRRVPPAPGARLPPCGSRCRGYPPPALRPAGRGGGEGRPLPFRGCRERGARRRSAPGSAAAAVTVCLCHVCAWAGGGAGPRRSQPADTPPSDRRPNRPTSSSSRRGGPPAQPGAPARYTCDRAEEGPGRRRDSEPVPREGAVRGEPAPRRVLGGTRPRPPAQRPSQPPHPGCGDRKKAKEI
ncbi:uncharacterized protein LOC141737584 [Larus michahellis]|uniref:uncharacterized protein LOC141737584 n=1 Tax=Larus michahellis TaxID=119627 RepID=UPI003D9B65F7